MDDKIFTLPEPRHIGEISVEYALWHRRSVREFANDPLTLPELSQVLWAAQGAAISGNKTAPSAGGLYPLEMYAVVGNVDGLSPGCYRYNSPYCELIQTREGDLRGDLCKAALDQIYIRAAAVALVIAAAFERTMGKYSSRGRGYVHMEAGHAAQNIYLQVETLKLGTVAIGAFRKDLVHQILRLPEGEYPLYIMPVGRLRE